MRNETEKDKLKVKSEKLNLNGESEHQSTSVAAGFSLRGNSKIRNDEFGIVIPAKAGIQLIMEESIRNV